MSNTPDTTPTQRPTDEIEPMIPILPSGGPTAERTRQTRPERQPETTYATEYTRDTEEIMPGVPDMR